ncbi:amino acid ABC transporter permease [Pseudomonas aeruginosa]|uniref:amino acid ABC transporter permease n=1 Tax=Pseudomonas aeruginosa TaxID=287 RepID=UPI00044E9C08|nr:amino acid ABC transporter permease [Pseudomonas aeruginosa]KAJ10236.1 ABC transporter permease [Pseudomonas aeruginosa ID4365]MDP4470257.1 amino acid ABC transporter permease [Pseudomonas aeruginosa]MDP4476406.1 amino acid ABC transporter permease [Pseudomonas aeruginosa]
MFEYSFYWSIVWAKFPELLQGAKATITLTIVSMLIGTLIALVLTLLRRQGKGVGYSLATTWVEVARNTPALFQIYMVYFGLGALGIQFSSYAAMLAALSFNNAGYLAETFRGGLKTIPPQQFSAARSLGISSFGAYVYVIFPQLFQVVFLPYVNQLNWALLNSSLGMIIGLRELTGATQAAQSESFRTFEFFIVAAAMYYLMAKTIEGGARLAFWRLFKR